MGGGASKSHNNTESTSKEEDISGYQQLRDQQKYIVDSKDCEAKGHPGAVALSSPSIPKQSPRAERAQTQVLLGNNREDERDGCSYSPQSSRDDREDLDYHPSNEEEEDEDMEREGDDEDDEEAQQLRMLFTQSAMSMDMDNEDLIFNLLYFGGDTSNFASMMNNAAEETVAAHSAGNTYVTLCCVVFYPQITNNVECCAYLQESYRRTNYICYMCLLSITATVMCRPYKLTPATELALQKLRVMTVTEPMISALKLQECSICQEEMEVGDLIAEMPGCSHCFHNECVLKWFALVSRRAM
jgi:hypothetical protein